MHCINDVSSPGGGLAVAILGEMVSYFQRQDDLEPTAAVCTLIHSSSFATAEETLEIEDGHGYKEIRHAALMCEAASGSTELCVLLTPGNGLRHAKLAACGIVDTRRLVRDKRH
jgi:hypothetical protein